MTDLFTDEDVWVEVACAVCGCITEDACVDTEGHACYWVADDLCSACVPKVTDEALITYLADNHLPLFGGFALIDEAKRRGLAVAS